MVRIIEVGPRDGLQNEKVAVPTQVKEEFVRDLAGAGLSEIEVSSFVSPKWVPQLGDAAELFERLVDFHGKVKMSALVPNGKGLSRAIEVGVNRIALFTAASEAFTKKNINMTIDESLDAFWGVMDEFRQQVNGGWVRGYVSTIVECPFAGSVQPTEVARVVKALVDLGVDEVSLGETLGVAVPSEIISVAEAIEDVVAKEKVAWHFHDTRGTAMSLVAAVMERGYTAFDASAGGLGGCPYAPGAGGNLATDDLVYFLDRCGVHTGVDAVKLAEASAKVWKVLGREPVAKAQIAVLSHCVG